MNMTRDITPSFNRIIPQNLNPRRPKYGLSQFLQSIRNIFREEFVSTKLITINCWKLEKITNSVYSLLSFILSLSLFIFSIVLCAIFDQNIFFSIAILILNEAATIYKLKKVTDQEEDEVYSYLKATLLGRLIAKAVTLSILLLMTQTPEGPAILAYLWIAIYYGIDSGLHFFFRSIYCFRDLAVVTHKFMRLILLLQGALMMEREKVFKPNEFMGLKTLWPIYIATFVYFVFFILLVVVSIGSNIISLSKKRWKFYEKDSFLGQIWTICTFFVILMIFVFVLVFNTRLIEIRKKKFQDLYGYKYYVNSEKKIIIIVFGSIFSILLLILFIVGILIRKSIDKFYQRVTFIRNHSKEDIALERYTGIENEQTVEKKYKIISLKKFMSKAKRDFKYMLQQSDELFLGIKEIDLADLSRLDTKRSEIKSPAESFEKKENDLIGINLLTNEDKENSPKSRRNNIKGQRCLSAKPKFYHMDFDENNEMDTLIQERNKSTFKRHCLSPDMKPSHKLDFENSEENRNLLAELSAFDSNAPRIKDEPSFALDVQIVEKKPKVKTSKKPKHKKDEENGRKVNTNHFFITNNGFENSREDNKELTFIEKTKKFLKKIFKSADPETKLKQKKAKRRRKKVAKKMKRNKKLIESTLKLGGQDEWDSEVFESGLCTICVENSVNSIFQPCGHGCSCFSCSKTLLFNKPECIFCRKEVDKLVKLDLNYELDGMYKVKSVYNINKKKG